jgi:hypothetical protein
MRNLFVLAIAYAVTLTEDDVLELGHEPSNEDFKNWFEIPEDAVENEFKKNEDFTAESLVAFMNEEEKAEIAGVPGTETAAPAVESVKETAAAKKKRLAAEKVAASAAEGTNSTAKTDETAPPAAPKAPGVIASILNVIKESEAPVSEAQILAELIKLFPDRESAAMQKTVKAQLGGKAQPLRMESEKDVKFVLTQTEVKEGEKSQRLYAIAK